MRHRTLGIVLTAALLAACRLDPGIGGQVRPVKPVGSDKAGTVTGNAPSTAAPAASKVVLFRQRSLRLLVRSALLFASCLHAACRFAPTTPSIPDGPSSCAASPTAGP